MTKKKRCNLLSKLRCPWLCVLQLITDMPGLASASPNKPEEEAGCCRNGNANNFSPALKHPNPLVGLNEVSPPAQWGCQRRGLPPNNVYPRSFERRAVTAMKEFLHEKEQALLVLIRLVEGETVAAVIHFQSCQFLSVSQCLRRPGLPGSYYLVTRLDH